MDKRPSLLLARRLSGGSAGTERLRFHWAVAVQPATRAAAWARGNSIRKMRPFEESHTPPAARRASFALMIEPCVSYTVKVWAWGSLFKSRIFCHHSWNGSIYLKFNPGQPLKGVLIVAFVLIGSPPAASLREWGRSTPSAEFVMRVLKRDPHALIPNTLTIRTGESILSRATQTF